MRIIGLDIHRVFAEAVALEDGVFKRLGRIGMTRDHLTSFARTLCATDHIVVEATGNATAVTDIRLIAAPNGYGARIEAVVLGEVDQRRMEADGVAAPLQNGAFEIVIELNPRHAAPSRECLGMAAQEILQPGIEEEAQKDPARIAQHHDERHQRPPCPSDREMPEVTPVDLGLFARQGAQAQISFRCRSRPMAGDVGGDNQDERAED